MSSATLSIEGMTCAACSGAITQTLEAMEHVHEVSVSLLTNEAKIHFAAPVTAQDLVRAVEDCGFDAKVLLSQTALPAAATTTITISGMTCAACVGSITQALEAMAGVESALVSLLTGSAKITHAESVAPAALVAAIEDCGFDATVERTSGAAAQAPAGAVVSRFAVQGMTCGSCSAAITQQVQQMHGVQSVTVSLLTEEAAVTHTAQLQAEEVRQAIEACGFDAQTVALAAQGGGAARVEELLLQIYGIDEHTDVAALQYNVEAVLHGFPGVQTWQLALKGQWGGDGGDGPEREHEDEDELLIDELRVTLRTDISGVRLVVEALGGVDAALQFCIINSVDQHLTSQLKLLTRVKDIQQWRSTFFSAVAFGVPVIVLGLSEKMAVWKTHLLVHGLYLVSVIEFALATHILFNLGAPFFKKFGAFVRNRGRNANMDVLVCILTLISYLFSLYLMALSVWTGQSAGPPKVLFETEAMLIIFVAFGKWIENKAKGATLTALSRLISLTPTTCSIVTDPDAFRQFVAQLEKMRDVATRTISIDLIEVNDVCVVAPGGKVPADGVVVFGETEIDESIITGEAEPVYKKVGSTVIGGSINGASVMYLRVTAAGKSLQLHQIIDIVKELQVKKAPVQRYADYVAAIFVVGVLVLALATFVFWALCLVLIPARLPKAFRTEENGAFYVCVKLAILVVVVACPCALGLAAPTAVMVGTGVGATHGALIKGGDILEKASKTNVVLFDKTGTLTCGEMLVARHRVMGALDEAAWWSVVGALEVGSEHPTGRAIVREARRQLALTFEEDLFAALVRDFRVKTGMGVAGEVTWDKAAHAVAVGNGRMVVREHPSLRAQLAEVMARDLSQSVLSVAHVVVDGRYCGWLELVDTVKPNTRAVMDYLRYVEGYQVGIVTGDNERAAHRIGRELGILPGNIFADMTPLDKAEVVAEVRARLGGPGNVLIAFVGDGINDAPALVGADIGMTIATGTDIALDLAQVVVMGARGAGRGAGRDLEGGAGRGAACDLEGVITALQVLRATFRKIKWNFVCATVYNLVMVPFAMGCFLPLNMMLPPGAAAAAMACSLITVVLNLLWLKLWTPPQLGAQLGGARVPEEAVGAGFSLRHSLRADFDRVKRAARARWPVFARAKSHDYEMLPSP